MNSLKLIRKTVDKVLIPPIQQHAFVLTVEAQAVQEDDDPKVFVMQASMGDDEFIGDTMVAVASAMQMRELPADAPITEPNEDNEIVPYYRVSAYSMFFKTPADMADHWHSVCEDVRDLINNTLLLEEAEVEEEIVITSTLTN